MSSNCFQLFKTNFHYWLMFNPIFLAIMTWIYNTKMTSIEPQAGKDLGGKQTQINPWSTLGLAGSHSCCQGSSLWGQEGPYGRAGWKHSPWHCHHSPWHHRASLWLTGSGQHSIHLPPLSSSPTNPALSHTTALKCRGIPCSFVAEV